MSMWFIMEIPSINGWKKRGYPHFSTLAKNIWANYNDSRI